MTLKSKAKKINQILALKYPSPESALIWKNPWEMLVSALLSAQTTDKLVNKVTAVFFQMFPTPQSIVNSEYEDIYTILRPVNYSKSKTSYVIYNAHKIINEYNGKVPKSIEELIKFKGIGRKVANVILGDVFKTPKGIVVDTHVKRVSYRLGLTKNTDPQKIEKDLIELFPKSQWIQISHRLIFHGREICAARKPKCEICPLNKFCDFFNQSIA